MARPEPFSRRVCTIAASATIDEAARQMARETVGSLIVTDDGRPIGLVTDRDLALQGLLGEHPIENTLVRECTSTPLLTLPLDSDVATMARTLKLHGVRRLALVDSEERPVGMVSADDLLRYLGCEVGQLATAVQREFQAESEPCNQPSSIFGKE